MTSRTTKRRTFAAKSGASLLQGREVRQPGDGADCSCRFSSFAGTPLVTGDLLRPTTRMKLFGPSHSEPMTLCYEFQKFLARPKSQLRAGINFLNPAFELTLRRPCFWS